MCQNCAERPTQAAAPERVRVNAGASAADAYRDAVVKHALAEQAKHHTDQPTVLFEGRSTVKIKPLATLDDALISGAKVSRLVYPASLTEPEQILKYQSDLLRAVSNLNVLPEESKFEGLTAVLALVLMGFNPEDIGDVKELLRASLEKAAEAEVRKNTTAFLQENGFGQI